MDLVIYSQVLKCVTVEELQSALLQYNLTVHAARKDGFSLLHSFALLGSYSICKYLCSNGARPTVFSVDNSTVFHSAVRAKATSEDEERANILKLFLDKGDCEIDLNITNSNGWTAIKLAARRSLEKCVEVLLSYGADPNIADNEKFTALHNAVANVDILKLLLSKCSNVNTRNNKGETPLYAAVEKGNVESVNSLLEHDADPNIVDSEGVSPLFLATKDGSIKLTELLVKHGANVNVRGAKQNISPLHWAAHKENDEMALFLIQHGADILLTDNEERTPISMASPALAEQMIGAAKSLNPEIDMASTNVETMSSAADKAVAACCGGNVHALTVLLDSGISVNHLTGESQSTLLHMAAYCGQLPVVAYLLSKEANIKAVDKDQDTVLHFACMKEVSHGLHSRTLELLLNTPAKALVNKPNSKGDTPIMVATRCSFPARVKILLKHNADSNIANNKKELPLHRACASTDNIESVMMFADLSTNIDIQDEDGWTPLMFAAKSGSAAVVQYLLQRGAKPNKRQSAGFTALYLAAQEGHASTCWYLLEGGADPNITGGPQDLAPLHIAAHHNATETCKLLLEYGGDPSQRDADGDTPLDLVTSPALKTFMLHAYQKMGDKNRAPTTARQESCEQVFDNEAIVGDIINLNNDVTDDVTNISGVGQGANGDATFTNNDAAPTNNDVTSTKNDATPTNNDVTSTNNDATPTNNDSTPTNNIVVTNDDVTTNDITLVTKEQQYLTRITELERRVETLTTTNTELLHKLSELSSKYEDHMTSHDALCQERDQFRLERNELQKRLDDLVARNSPSLQNDIVSPPPNSDALKLIDHTNVTLGQLVAAGDVIPHLTTHMGTYHSMDVTVATMDCKKTSVSIVKTELAQLSHLVQLLATAVDQEHHMIYLVYENIGIATLDNVIHRHGDQPFTWQDRIRLLSDIAVAMGYLHSCDPSISHHCLCPSVVQVYETAAGQRAKICHYGMVKVHSNHSNSKASMKIVPYTSPEVLQGHRHVNSSDVYSYGMLMYETITDYAPYSDTGGSNVIAMVNKIISGAKLVFPKLTGKYPECDQAVSQAVTIVNGCHSNNQNDRPSFTSIITSLKLL